MCWVGQRGVHYLELVQLAVDNAKLSAAYAHVMDVKIHIIQTFPLNLLKRPPKTSDSLPVVLSSHDPPRIHYPFLSDLNWFAILAIHFLHCDLNLFRRFSLFKLVGLIVAHYVVVGWVWPAAVKKVTDILDSDLLIFVVEVMLHLIFAKLIIDLDLEYVDLDFEEFLLDLVEFQLLRLIWYAQPQRHCLFTFKGLLDARGNIRLFELLRLLRHKNIIFLTQLCILEYLSKHMVVRQAKIADLLGYPVYLDVYDKKLFEVFLVIPKFVEVAFLN